MPINGTIRTNRPDGPGNAPPFDQTANVIPDLAHAMTTNPLLKVQINAGYFDLLTPYFQGKYEMRHLPIAQELRDNIEYRCYQSGHMVYLTQEALAQLHDNVADFIERTDNLPAPSGPKTVNNGRMRVGPMILFAGDPHRNFSPIIRACLARPPATLILLGDLDCTRPLQQELASLLAAGWRISWILGNHDCETEAAYDNLVSNHPEGDSVFEWLSWRVTASPVCLACSNPRSGIRAWMTAAQRIEPPRFRNSNAFLAAQPKSRWWRGGLPLWHRDSIFPDDVDLFAQQRFDILVTHEAPSCHRHGFAVIDDLASAGGAKLIVHGHHHNSYAATLPNGIAVRGLGLAEPWPYG